MALAVIRCRLNDASRPTLSSLVKIACGLGQGQPEYTHSLIVHDYIKLMALGCSDILGIPNRMEF